MLVSIAGVDRYKSGAVRVRLDDLTPGTTSPTTVAAYVWADHIIDFNRFVEAVQEAGLDRVSEGGIDLAQLRESWESHRPQIEHFAQQATWLQTTN